MSARYILGRLLRALLTLLFVITFVFGIVHFVPGDPVDTILSDQASFEEREAMRRALHLDESLPQQYARFLSSIADGTLGYSFRRSGVTVASMIADVMPSTVILTLSSLLLAWAIALPLGAIAATLRGSLADRLAMAFAALGLAIPNIWLGPLLILVFAVNLRFLPIPGDDSSGFLGLILPSITLGTSLAAILTRQIRGSLGDVLGELYIVAARARGLGRLTILVKHALRNALLPVMTLGAAQLGALLSGAIVAEKIFERDGLGTLFLEAFFARDLPVVQGTVLLIASIYIGVNLLLDLAYGLVDRRASVAR
ncbi:MAG: ABC transporter permease [Sandaracinaceae bacterium]|nr:ABC transporter permease [Sandaracinaceae bacterium]